MGNEYTTESQQHTADRGEEAPQCETVAGHKERETGADEVCTSPVLTHDIVGLPDVAPVIGDSEVSPATVPDGEADNVAEGPVGTAGHAQLGAGDSPASSGSQVFQWGPCMRCGHQWNSRRGANLESSIAKPKWCAKCRSVGWETLARPKRRSNKVKKLLVKRKPRVTPPIPIESAPESAVAHPVAAVVTPAVTLPPSSRPPGVLTPPPGWSK